MRLRWHWRHNSPPSVENTNRDCVDFLATTLPFIHRVYGNVFAANKIMESQLTMSSLEQRTASIEMQLSFLEDTVASLDAALATQQQQIIELQMQNRLLQQQIKEQGARLDTAEPADNTPPPHY